MCPVPAASEDKSGCASGLALPGPGLADFQIQLLSALMAQTEAIGLLAHKIGALIDAMCEAEGMDEAGTGGYTTLDQPAR
jgi:hypothetical protein